MTLKRWRMLVATKIVLAAGVAGEASAQQGGILQPPANQIIVQGSCGPTCAPRKRRPSNLESRKGRLNTGSATSSRMRCRWGSRCGQAMTTQVDNGVAMRMILNDFDFDVNRRT